MTNMIGLHLMANPDQNKLAPVLDKLQPNMCVVLVTLNQAHYAASLARNWPTIKWVVAPWWTSQGTRDSFSMFQESATQREAGEEYFNPDIAWKNWLNIDGGLMRQFHETLKGIPNVWIQGHNEVGVGREYVDWEKQRAKLTRFHYNIKSVVINDGVGKSEFAHYQMYQQLGLYNILRETGGALGRHDYAGALLELWHGEVQAVRQEGEARPLAKHPKEYINNVPVYEAARFNDRGAGDLGSHLAFRVLRDHHYINETGGGDIPIFIVEFGYDDAGAQSLTPYYSNTYTPRGLVRARKIWDEWGLSNHDEILGKQMAYADQQLRKVPMVQGAAWFQYGEHNSEAWRLFNLDGVNFVQPYLDALADVEPPPPPPPEPPDAAISSTVPLAVIAGTTVTLSSASTGEIVGHRWDITGPGGVKTIDNGPIVEYTFNGAGVYNVKLTVSGSGGSDVTDLYITVTAKQEPPTPEPEPGFTIPNLPDWIPFMVGTITGAAIVLVTMGLI